MFILTLQCPAQEKDMLISNLWDRNTEGVIEEGDRIQAFFSEQFDVAEFAAYAPQWKLAEERDWVAETQQSWKPFAVGQRFFLVPAWLDDAAPEGRLRLTIHPGLAFGTGADTTTQLCLEAMERNLRLGAHVLDLGTGTGILAEAALLLGAGSVTACDIDRDAAAQARLNIPSGAGVFAGSSRAIRTGSMDLIVANINAHTINVVADDLLRIARPGGTVVLSGVPVRDEGMLRLPFPVSERVERKEWLGLVCHTP
jgi:ribosomal protein L11 methyltransferase